MTERFWIFRQTIEEINRRLENIRGSLQDNTGQLGSLDMDGDMTDDPILHGLKGERERLTEEEIKLLGYLKADLSYVSEDDLEASVGIKNGHLIHMKILYPDGDEEETEVTLGSSLDSSFLGKLGVISDKTPLGRVLLGRKEGDTVEYEAPTGRGHASILNVSPSPLLKLK